METVHCRLPGKRQICWALGVRGPCRVLEPLCKQRMESLLSMQKCFLREQDGREAWKMVLLVSCVFVKILWSSLSVRALVAVSGRDLVGTTQIKRDVLVHTTESPTDGLEALGPWEAAINRAGHMPSFVEEASVGGGHSSQLFRAMRVCQCKHVIPALGRPRQEYCLLEAKLVKSKTLP